MPGTDGVEFTPVLEGREHEVRSEPTSRADPEPEADTVRRAAPALKTERERYPLAGPILQAARDRVLRGRCSRCGTDLSVRTGRDQGATVHIRCPICGRTGEVEV